jgi:hypothetical protein
MRVVALHRRVVALAMGMLVALGPTAVGSVRAVTVTANPDTYNLKEDQTLTVDAGSGLLSNDDPSSGSCVVSTHDLSSGSLGSGVAADGAFTFTPDANFNGGVTFKYDMAAGADCPSTIDDTATVTILISAVNDPPTISAKNDCADGSITVFAGSGAYPSSLPCLHFESAGPSNESSQTLDSWVIAGASGTVGFASGPTITKSGNDGYLQFTPLSGAGNYGDATISVQARDSGGTTNGGVDLSNTIDIHIHVLDNPPVANADSFIVLKNTTLNVQAPGVLKNDSDPDGDAIYAQKVTNPSHGVVTLAVDGSFSYTPATGYTGPDAFSYKATDTQQFSATRVVTLTVTAIPPINTPTPPPPAPTPEPTPTLAPGVTPGPTPTPGDTPAAAATLTLVTEPPGAAATTTPVVTPPPGPTSDASGGPSLPVLLVIVLLVLLLAFGGAVYLPRLLGKRGGAPPGTR